MTIQQASSLSASTLLEGRRVLVTGAAGGIGMAITQSLERHGAEVIRTDKRAAPGILPLDVTDEDAVARGFDTAGRITDVVHSAGDLIVGPVAATSLEAFRAASDNNLLGAFLVGREAARRLQSGDSLTFIASQAGFRAGANWGIYCAVKAGVMRLSEALAHELGPRNIRVNSICPGSVDTPMLTDVYARLGSLSGETPDAVRQRYSAVIPLRRNATAGEIGDVCVFLVSALASYVSGASIPVDGGEVSA
ncbi:MAG: SDR family NAD(P)-dependent oxidoreductase [Parvibaculaceae bacterium]